MSSITCANDKKKANMTEAMAAPLEVSDSDGEESEYGEDNISR